VNDALERHAIDVVHLHGIDYVHFVPAGPVPAVVTLHLPWVWYSSTGRHPTAEQVHLVCVSTAQQRSWERPGLPVIENGVDVQTMFR
jgi:hypothetical protein